MSFHRKSCKGWKMMSANESFPISSNNTITPQTRNWTRGYYPFITAHTHTVSVTRLGDFLLFGQLFKAGGKNYLAQIAHILGNFCKGVKIFHFSSAIIFGQLLWRFGDFLLVTLHIVHANSRCIHQHKTKIWPKTNIVWLAHWLDDGGAQAVSVLPMNRVWIPLKSIILSVKLITFKKSE